MSEFRFYITRAAGYAHCVAIGCTICETSGDDLHDLECLAVLPDRRGVFMTRRLPLQCWIRKLGWVLTTLVVVLILYFSFIPAESAPRVSWIPFADKGAHLIAYAAFGFSSFWRHWRFRAFDRKRRRGLPSAALPSLGQEGRSS